MKPIYFLQLVLSIFFYSCTPTIDVEEYSDEIDSMLTIIYSNTDINYLERLSDILFTEFYYIESHIASIHGGKGYQYVHQKEEYLDPLLRTRSNFGPVNSVSITKTFPTSPGNGYLQPAIILDTRVEYQNVIANEELIFLVEGNSLKLLEYEIGPILLHANSRIIQQL